MIGLVALSVICLALTFKYQKAKRTSSFRQNAGDKSTFEKMLGTKSNSVKEIRSNDQSRDSLL